MKRSQHVLSREAPRRRPALAAGAVAACLGLNNISSSMSCEAIDIVTVTGEVRVWAGRKAIGGMALSWLGAALNGDIGMLAPSQAFVVVRVAVRRAEI